MKILTGNLKDKAEDLAKFLEPRVGTKPNLSGSEIEIQDDSVRKGLKPRHVKTYVKRFLFQSGLRKNFRVLVQAKELRLVEVELPEEEEKPSPPEKAKEEPEAPAEPKAPEAAAEKEPKEKKEEESPKKKPRKKKAATG